MENSESAQVAIIDDYVQVAETIAAYVRRMGLTAEVYTNPLVFLDELKVKDFDIAITDIRMPQMDGISLLKKVRERAPKTQVIVVSAHADKNDAIDALKYGAYDFFEKPVSEGELVATIKRTLGYKKALMERDELAEKLSLVSEKEAKKWGIKAFVGNGTAMKEVLQKLRLLQKSSKTNVLVLGESGTGKELMARAIHFGSERSRNPFVAVNCSAIPEDLAESILFGHTKGAFTGATADRKGKFELADDGTLFLDEIGDMSAVVQTKLLRVLEDGVVVPVGKEAGKHVNVRVVSATNTDIEARTTSGKFRSDLYHRLSGYVVKLPSLRERKEDLEALVKHFTSLLAEEMGITAPKADKHFMDALKGYDFPGNVRELRNILERAMIDAGGGALDARYLQLRSVSNHTDPVQPVEGGAAGKPQQKPEDESIPLDLKEAEVVLVRRVLDRAQGNVAEASRLLGISRAKIYRILG